MEKEFLFVKIKLAKDKLRWGSMFDLKVYKDKIGLIELSDRLARESVISFRQKAVEYIEANDLQSIILDFTNLNWIDSAGIGVLMVIYKLLSGKKGTLVFVNPNKQISDIFSILKLNQIFKIVPSIEEALQVLETEVKV